MVRTERRVGNTHSLLANDKLLIVKDAANALLSDPVLAQGMLRNAHARHVNRPPSLQVVESRSAVCC
ncbi:hypothetical protein CBOM_07785 [Ceraceosorus bombacis]|uniref:Uncharacterized protein n=1 Tax=Ceraceosorus bombacis TaxID=401625 RepID=A0A0P1BNG1_9BASI|nr:hypothetical protein CBOM_07785 [Ceraceosorus bombacis]